MYCFTVGLTSIIFAINCDYEALNHVMGIYTPPEVVHMPAIEESSAASKHKQLLYLSTRVLN